MPGCVLAGVILVLAATGCDHAPDDEMVPRPTPSETVVSRAASPLPTLLHGASTWVAGHPARVRGSVIEAGGQRVDVAPLRADRAVSTRGGTYFLNGGELWFTSGTGARSTGFLRVGALVVSPDGRWLGFVDRNHGPSRPGRTRLAATIVYDTTTGQVLLRSYAGMGSIADDLASAYAAAPPRAIGFDGAALLVRTPAGRYRFPLDGSRPTRVG